ncbi:GNAT family N-acetyltransferase [Arthrobacter woluwensis]|uniref:[SSU ribosomal protein S5P]-alanine acetyltransferase n=1 Tax=Arthrobacter woluwensis TaxID=156980 RepID=A0A1H4MSP3_9MICC|nr:GNAT family protein [Arthrobacter woluwensis]SEB85867.1 [SSU ribosomal protein S5P]-alanine acetyltransferase [Arthrobacter woluwensis]
MTTLRPHTLRPITLNDAPAVAALLQESREHLAPWEPVRPEFFFTEEGQRAEIRGALDALAQGSRAPFVIVDDDGAVAGRLNINNIVRGAFESGSLGYWVAAGRTGRGLAGRAVGEAVEHGFSTLGLHRLEAGTLLHNTASQRVLLKNGFTVFGTAPRYLRIQGRWQDHRLFQRLNEG